MFDFNDFDDFDTQINVEDFNDGWFEELIIADMLINDDQWEDFI